MRTILKIVTIICAIICVFITDVKDRLFKKGIASKSIKVLYYISWILFLGSIILWFVLETIMT